jgi:hypothetical protein
MKNPIVPLVPDHRLREIIRGYVVSKSTATTRPDMNDERHLMKLAQVLTDEAFARIPLYELEVKNMIQLMKLEAKARNMPRTVNLLSAVGDDFGVDAAKDQVGKS